MTYSSKKGKSETFISEMSGHHTAQLFTLLDFYAAFEFGFFPETDGDKYESEFNDHMVYFDAQTEYRMFRYLVDTLDVQECVSQGIKIPYTKRNRENSKIYIPDLAFITTEGYIGIIEVKPTTDMALDECIDKYNELSAYCKEKGYLYAMVDPDNDNMTFEKMKSLEVNEDLSEMFEIWYYDGEETMSSDTLNKYIDAIKRNETGLTKKKLMEQLVALVIQNSDTVGIKGHTAHFPAKWHELYKR